MRTLDEIDREILRLLLDDARRPYSDIAERVDLSAPAVSDRVDRLREIGVIERFTVDVDRSLLSEGVPVLVRLDVPGTAVADVRDALAAAERVDHLFETAEGEIAFTAVLESGAVRPLLAETVGLEDVEIVDVAVLTRHEWEPSLGEPELSIPCVECGNTVGADGEQSRIDGTLYHFC